MLLQQDERVFSEVDCFLAQQKTVQLGQVDYIVALAAGRDCLLLYYLTVTRPTSNT
jgi:hypothetical protein